jgi:hypothetical protein
MHKCINLVCNVIFIPEFLWYWVVVGKFDEDEEGGEECSEVSIPTVSDALEAIRVVNLFYESRGGSSEIVTKIMDIERNLESVYWASNRKQMKIIDYCTRI